jgi:DNA-binding response OmpR family regulator
MKLLLVGEDSSFLRVLSLDLLLAGFAVKIETDAAGLGDALQQFAPDVVVFDHVEPMDLFALNPRDCGYEGPLVILVSSGIPQQLLDRLQATNVVEKPFVLEILSAELRLVAGG